MEERIKELRKALGKTQQDFADSLELSRNFIAQVETGAKTPSERTLKDICREFKVNYDWLVNGTGEMFLERDSGDEIAEFLSSLLDDDDTSIRKRFILALSKFDGDDWATVEKFLDNFTKTEKDGE